MASIAGCENSRESVMSSEGSAKIERCWRDGRRVSMVIKKEASFLLRLSVKFEYYSRL